jgi:hypothetical protein
LKQVKAFLAILTYYRRCLNYLSEKGEDLIALTRNNPTRLQWNAKAEKAFNDLKLLVEQSHRIHPCNPNKDFFCSSDASSFATNFCVWQYDDEGTIHYCGSSSRVFNKHERNASVYKKEIIAILAGLKIWNFALQFSRIRLFCDAKSVIWLRVAKDSDDQLRRFAMVLSMYDLTVTHVTSRLNNISDLYSRMYEKKPTSQNPIKQQKAVELMNLIDPPEHFEIGNERLRNWWITDGPQDPTPSKPAPKKRTKVEISSKTLKPEMVLEKKQKKPGPHRVISNRTKYEGQANMLESTVEEGVETTQADEPEESIQPMPQGQEEVEDAITSNEELTHNERINMESKAETNNPKEGENKEGTSQLDNMAITRKIILEGMISKESFRIAQDLDEDIQKIMEKSPTPKDFKIIQGILVKWYGDKKDWKIYIPKSLIELLITSHHVGIMGSHRSKTQIHDIISRKYYHPKLKEYIEDNLDRCFHCLSEKSSKQPPAKLGRKNYPTNTRECIAFDIADGLVSTTNGYKMIAVFVDTYSLWVQLHPLRQKSAAELKKAFETRVVQVIGPPHQLYSDGEAAIFSGEFLKYCELIGTKVSSTASYSPFSNSLAEKMVGITKETLRLLCRETGSAWTTYLPIINFALNQRCLKAYNLSPNELMFGSRKEVNELLRIEDDREEIDSMQKHVKNLKDRLAAMRKCYVESRNQIDDRQNARANRRKREKVYEENQIVMCRDNTLTEIRGSALKSPYIGPFIIESIEPNRHVCLIKCILTGRIRRVHKKFLRPIKKVPNRTVIPTLDEEPKMTLRSAKQHTTKPEVGSPKMTLRSAASRSSKPPK